jgi:hypothetical protein
MPLFIDHHRHVEGLTAEAVADAHRKDEEIQDEYGVKYLKYWFNEKTGEVFCLADAPEQGGGRGRAPRGPRAGCRRDNRGRGRRGLGGANTHAHLPGAGRSGSGPYTAVGVAPFSFPLFSRTVSHSPGRYPPSRARWLGAVPNFALTGFY